MDLLTPQTCIHGLDAQEPCNQCSLPTSVSDGTMDLRAILAGILQCAENDIEPESDCAFTVGRHQYVLYDPKDADERRAHDMKHEKPTRVYTIALLKI